jgi:hydroxyacylglutathione hydrolase
MAVELVTIPCLADNYAYLIRDEATGQTALIDVPEAAPILAELAHREWALHEIWLTHHHDDHIQGVAELRAATGARVIGAEADRHRLPTLDQALRPGDMLPFGAEFVQVLDAPGHTVGHIAFFLGQAGLAFTGDSLMAGGCGRLFEGTPAQMFATLTTLAALPGETLICSGHEYTQSNLRFALHVDPLNPALTARMMRVVKARAEGRPTVPSRLSGEMQTNPFLRAHEPALAQAVGLEGATPAEVFSALRAAKNNF